MNLKVTLTSKTLAAAVVILLAAVVALAATLVKGTGAGPVDAPALAQKIATEKDQVTPGELARWIMEKKQDYLLVDIRAPWQYDDYHIPTAINVPLSELFESAGLAKLSRGKKVVLYGLGAGQAAQAQLLLNLKGYDAYSLQQGLAAWWRDIMTPVSLQPGSTSPAGFRQAKQVRQFFMGTAKPAAAAPAQAPVIPPSTPPAQSPTHKKRLKLGKGCS